jgi:hypothetical protein
MVAGLLHCFYQALSWPLQVVVAAVMVVTRACQMASLETVKYFPMIVLAVAAPTYRRQAQAARAFPTDRLDKVDKVSMAALADMRLFPFAQKAGHRVDARPPIPAAAAVADFSVAAAVLV